MSILKEEDKNSFRTFVNDKNIWLESKEGVNADKQKYQDIMDEL
jgi:hypothetical protein